MLKHQTNTNNKPVIDSGIFFDNSFVDKARLMTAKRIGLIPQFYRMDKIL